MLQLGMVKLGGKIKDWRKAAFSWVTWCLVHLWPISLRDVSAGRGGEMEVGQAEVIGKAGTVGFFAVGAVFPHKSWSEASQPRGEAEIISPRPHKSSAGHQGCPSLMNILS